MTIADLWRFISECALDIGKDAAANAHGKVQRHNSQQRAELREQVEVAKKHAHMVKYLAQMNAARAAAAATEAEAFLCSSAQREARLSQCKTHPLPHAHLITLLAFSLPRAAALRPSTKPNVCRRLR